MVHNTLMQFNGGTFHPVELVLALAECCGRVIHQVRGSDIARRELVDVAVKQMAAAIEAGDKRIIQ